MLNKIAKRLSELIIKKSKRKNINRLVLVYGFELLISQSIIGICIVFLGLFVGCGWEAFVFLLSFGSLRIFCGGFHAATYRNCFVFSLMTAISVLLLSTKLSRLNLIWDSVIIEAIAFWIIFFLAPRQHHRHPVSKEIFFINKKRARIVLSVQAILFVIMIEMKQMRVIYTLSLSEIAVAILLIWPNKKLRKEKIANG